MTKLKLIAAAVAAILTIVVVLQNTQTVETRLLFITVAMPRAALLLSTFGAGVVVGLLLALALASRRSRQ